MIVFIRYDLNLDLTFVGYYHGTNIYQPIFAIKPTDNIIEYINQLNNGKRRML